MVAVSDFSGLVEFGLRLGQRGRDRADRFTGALHGRPPRSSRSKLTAPDLERLARTPCPIASLASSGIRAFEFGLGLLMLEEGRPG